MTKPSHEFTPDAFDLAILRALPAEGATLGRYIADAMSVKTLRAQVDRVPTSEQYSSALKLMRTYGLVNTVNSHAGKPVGWQRTKKGDALIAPNLKQVAR